MTMWLSVDPLADKYPNISPYHYCHWNPIRLVDPDGKEDWEVDKLGNITKCKEQPETPTEDRIRVKGTDGWTEKNSISGLERGTISEQESRSLNGQRGSIISLGGNRADQVALFEFCANNSDVEYSLMEMKVGESVSSYLTTSHDTRSPSKDYIGDAYGSEIAKANALFLISHTHNHFGTGEYGWGASQSDFEFKKNIKDLQGVMGEQYPNYPVPNTTFSIYKCRGGDKKTIQY